jgi:hypothetical protein
MLRNAAIDHLLIASGTTMGVDTAAARRLSTRACDLLEDGDPRLGAALVQSVEAGYALGVDLETQRGLLDRAEAVSVELGDDRTLGRVFTWRSILTNDGTTNKLTLAERAVELLEPLPGPELARALTINAAVFMLREQSDEAIAAADAALPIVEEFGGPGDLALTLAARGVGRSDRGDAGGLADLRRGLDVVLDAGSASAPIAAINLASPLWIYEGPAAGLEVYEIGVREAERRGQTTVWVKREMPWVLTDLGRWDHALGVAEEALEGGRASGAVDTIAMAATSAATIHVRRGDVASAGALVDEILEIVHASLEPQVRDPGLGAAAEVRLAQHRPADALDLLREVAASHASGMFTSWQAPRMVRTALGAGDTRLASALVERTSYGLRLPPAVDLAERSASRPPAMWKGRVTCSIRPAGRLRSCRVFGSTPAA